MNTPQSLTMFALLSAACGAVGTKPPARPPDVNLEVEVLFDDPAHLVTTVVSSEHQVEQDDPTRSRYRQLYLSLRTGRQEVMVSQVFEEWLSVSPVSLSGSGMAGGQASGDSCYGQAVLDVAPGKQFKLRHHVHDGARCELECFLRSSGEWSRTPCAGL